jgi:hypothetical protein
MDPREDSYIQELAKMIADLRQESYKQLQRIEALEAAQQPAGTDHAGWHRLSDVKPLNGAQCLFRVHPNLLHSRGVWVGQSHSPSGFYTDLGLFVGDPALIWWSAIEPEAQQPLAPPIGVKPQWLADEERLGDLQAAIKRYEDSGHPVPPQWRAEAREIIERQEQRQQPQPADHIADASKMVAPPAPAGGLVERLANALAEVNGSYAPEVWLSDACTAIRVVAAWLEQQQEVPVGSASAGADYFAAMLRSEANR